MSTYNQAVQDGFSDRCRAEEENDFYLASKLLERVDYAVKSLAQRKNDYGFGYIKGVHLAQDYLQKMRYIGEELIVVA